MSAIAPSDSNAVLTVFRDDSSTPSATRMAILRVAMDGFKLYIMLKASDFSKELLTITG